ncbi:Reduced folate carrier,Major facilitator superfamily domain [Cinara cedri]|uniref:Reduced folate carrier,Major facilitator superfamily domain n=1 Tax=Cinara cedri TaxID=506608 RepID=A0A5E4NK68_9HEMI|nr:Reduced folate carrier,Major facilitator superfamily domain [Cinara cedri]
MDSWKSWKMVSLLVCVFAMVREIRPIEPFFTSHLVKNMNFTLNQVNENIYAVGTYSCLVLAVVIFLITDYFRYKPLIIADGIAGIFTYALLLGSPSLTIVQIEQMFFGFFYSSEVAFTTYLYAKVDDKRYYQKITSLVKASMLFGRFLSGLIAQTIVSTHLLDNVYLVYISIISTSFVTIWALFLPKVNYSLYFHRNKDPKLNNYVEHQSSGIDITGNTSNIVYATSKVTTIGDVIKIILNDFKSAYSNIYVVKQSFWWIMAVTGYIIVATYIQVLWENVNVDKKQLMNGAVESIHTLCGAIGAYIVGHLNYDWKKFGDIIFTIGSFLLGLLLFIICSCDNLWLLYILYITYGTLYQTLLTIATSEIAKHIKPDSYGLILGFNFFLSLLVISIFTLLFIQGLIVVIGTENQILTVSLTFFVMCIVFFIMTIKNWKK